MTVMMKNAVACLFLVALATVTFADNAPQTTVVVGEMCGGCVKRITSKLQQLDNVGAITCDVKQKSTTITPKPGHSLSPRIVWEAFESIGKSPVRLSGPSGTFTSKPAR